MKSTKNDPILSLHDLVADLIWLFNQIVDWMVEIDLICHLFLLYCINLRRLPGLGGAWTFRVWKQWVVLDKSMPQTTQTESMINKFDGFRFCLGEHYLK